MRGLIVAVSPEGVIGLDGTIPWHYPGDFKRFKRVTLGTTVIMGRKTWESLPRRPLSGRRNLVVTSRTLEGVECFPSVARAVAACTGDVWFIGGERVFAEGMELADVLDVTYVPDHIDDARAVKLPPIDDVVWQAGPLVPHEDEPKLTRRLFTRRQRA